DVNIVDPAAIKAEVAAAFDPPPNPAVDEPAPVNDSDPSGSGPSPDEGAPIDSGGIPCVN
ncbi:MAG: LytR family transcriptional regulator, partial [Mycobacterium sp.]